MSDWSFRWRILFLGSAAKKHPPCGGNHPNGETMVIIWCEIYMSLLALHELHFFSLVGLQHIFIQKLWTCTFSWIIFYSYGSTHFQITYWTLSFFLTWGIHPQHKPNKKQKFCFHKIECKVAECITDHAEFITSSLTILNPQTISGHIFLLCCHDKCVCGPKKSDIKQMQLVITDLGSML